ncbi:hypothetical protein ACWEZE_08810 [Staphylococcus shinii]
MTYRTSSIKCSRSTGTILAERLAYPFTYIGGEDIDSEAIDVAQDNLIDSPAEVN